MHWGKWLAVALVLLVGVVAAGSRKARLVADLIRGMPVDDAMTTLEFSKKRAAWYLKAVLKSAIANAPPAERS